MATHLSLERRPKPKVQRAESAGTAGPVVEDLASTLSSPMPGEPLPGDTRAYLEPRLGHSLSHVRVHTDTRADDLARTVEAEAFTTGPDIYLRSGAYAPESRSGVHLLAHEATHTLQQASGAVPGTPGPDGVSISSPEDGYEQAAEATAEAVTSDFGSVTSSTPPSGPAVQGSFEAPPPDGRGTGGGSPTLWRLAVQRCGPVPCDCSPEERAAAETDEHTPGVQRRVGELAIQRVVVDGSEIQSRIQGKVDSDVDQAKQEQQQEQQQQQDQQQQEQGGAGASAAQAPQEIDRAEVDAKKGELEGPAQPPVDPASQQGAVSAAADQAQSSADQPAQPVAETAAPPPTLADSSSSAGAAAIELASQAASVASQAFSQASSVSLPDLPPAVETPPLPAPLDAGGQPLTADPEADSFTESVSTRIQTLREQGHAVKARATNTRANAVRVQGNIQLAQGQVSQAQGGIQQSQEHTASRRDVMAQAQSALGVSQQKAATVAEQAPQVQSQADQGHAKTGPIASESQDLAGGAAANTPDDGEAAANAQQSGQQLSSASGDTQSVDSTIAQTQSRAGSLAQDAAQASATNANTASTIDATQASLEATDQRLNEMTGQASQAETQLAALADAPAEIRSQADQQDSTGDALIQASLDLETQLQSIQQDYLDGMASVPAAPEAAPASGSAGPPVQRDAADYAYSSRASVNVASVWSSPDSLSPAERQAQEQQRQQLAQQQAQHRRDQLNEINQLSGGHFDQLDATDKMGIALQLTLGNLFNSVGSINWPDMGANLIRGLIDPSVSLQGVVSGLNMVLSGGANLLSAEQWSRDPLGNLLKSAADIVTGLTIVLGSIAGLALALTVVCGALIIFSFGTLAPVLGPAIAFFTSVMATVGPWAIEFAEVALVLQGLVLIKNLIDAATAQTADQLYTASEKMTEDAKTAGQMAIQVGMAEIMGGGGEGPEAPTLEPEPGVIPAEPPALEPLPEPEPVVEPTEPAVEPGAEPAAPEGESPSPEGEPPAESLQDTLDQTANKSGSELTPDEVQAEMEAAQQAEPKPIDEPPFTEETELDNGHELKETEEGEFCRFSPGPGDCFDADGNPIDPPSAEEAGKLLSDLNTDYGEILDQNPELEARWDDIQDMIAEGDPEALQEAQELENDLKRLEQGETAPGEQLSPDEMEDLTTKPDQGAAAKYAHDIGVENGQAAAQADGLQPANWENPFGGQGGYGQGFDDIMLDANGDPVIVEYKGGSAELAEGQMSREWVQDNIDRLRPVDPQMADTLQNALDQGRLKGVVYSTPLDANLAPLPTMKMPVTF